MRFDTPVSIPKQEVERARKWYRDGYGVVCPSCLHRMQVARGAGPRLPYGQRHYSCVICRRVLMDSPDPGTHDRRS